jgi:hypothetical protein
MLPLQANEMEKLVIYALYKTLSMMINKGAKKEERVLLACKPGFC